MCVYHTDIRMWNKWWPVWMVCKNIVLGCDDVAWKKFVHFAEEYVTSNIRVGHKTVCKTAEPYIPRESILHIHCCNNLKYQVFLMKYKSYQMWHKYRMMLMIKHSCHSCFVTVKSSVSILWLWSCFVTVEGSVSILWSCFVTVKGSVSILWSYRNTVLPWI
jgi:hypothetical protein